MRNLMDFYKHLSVSFNYKSLNQGCFRKLKQDMLPKEGFPVSLTSLPCFQHAPGKESP